MTWLVLSNGAALREKLPALVRRMRADFAAATGNNPWETHDDQ